MKVLLVIHGYPMRYNAGSEVYTPRISNPTANQLTEQAMVMQVLTGTE